MKEYSQITLKEREKIYELTRIGATITKIASELKRNKSTISREIRRNKSEALGYLPDRADKLALTRKHRLLSKINRLPELKDYIVDRLTKDKWSPEIIAGRIKMEGKLPRVSHETIYQYIYSCHGSKLKLYESLIYKRPKRQLKYSRKKRILADEYKIRNRPKVINNRSEFGHFEGDLTFFKGSQKGNVAVLTERFSRKSFIVQNNTKSSGAVMLNLLKIQKELPEKTIKSVTFDNGGEFKQFGLLGLKGIKV